MLKSRIIVLAFSLLSQIVVSQDYHSKIIGDWVQSGSIYSNRLTQFVDPVFGISYVKLSIMQNVMYYSSNPTELRNPLGYQIMNDTLAVDDGKFILHFIDDDHIEFKSLKTNQLILFERIRPVDLSIYRIEKDTLYQASPNLTPRFQGEFVKAFFGESLISYPSKEDRKILISFILRSNGLIEEVKVTSNHSNHRNRIFEKAILKLQPYWHPASINGRKVSTKVELEVIRIGQRTINDRDKGGVYFFSGFNVIESDPDKAIQLFTKASLIDPSNAKYFFYRAYAYYFLLNEEKMCQDLHKARTLCPFIPWGIIDDAMGWKVECFFKY